MLDPIQRRRYGIMGIIFSGIFLLLAIGALVGNSYRREAVVEQIASANQECQSRLKTLGASVTGGDEKIVAKWDSVEGGYSHLGSASAGAMACPGWKMTSFCMGQECTAGPGAQMELNKIL
jgi:hypothetical protein